MWDTIQEIVYEIESFYVRGKVICELLCKLIMWKTIIDTDSKISTITERFSILDVYIVSINSEI